jgi:urease accessory protein
MSAEALRLWQLVSPALPVGAFSYSEGLEVLVQRGWLAGPEAVAAWLEAELARGCLAIEAAALPRLMAALAAWRAAAAAAEAEAMRLAAASVRDLDGWLLAQREAAELRQQQRQMGAALLRLLADLGWPLPAAPEPAPEPQPQPQPALAWPAAWAWAGLCLELPPQALVEAYLFGWVANQLSAAVRLVPIGATEAQRLQLRLAPRIAERAGALVTADPHQLWNGGVGAGLAQLAHAELYSRLFRS